MGCLEKGKERNGCKVDSGDVGRERRGPGGEVLRLPYQVFEKYGVGRFRGGFGPRDTSICDLW